MTQKPLRIALEFSPDEAWAFAQFLKRAGHSDFRALACDDEEAYTMRDAAELIRAALTVAGCAPR